MSERERIEKIIYYLRLAEGLCLRANDPRSFEEIRELIADLEKRKEEVSCPPMKSSKS
jgi:hypothetical protein